MNKNMAISLLFIAASLYDGVLGLLFLFAGGSVFRWFEVTPPNHLGYVQFPAALLIVFSLMFLAIARNPSKNYNLIPYGMLLKVSYCSVVFFHWFTTDIPHIWKPFAVYDLVFLVLFAWSYMTVHQSLHKLEKAGKEYQTAS